MLLEHTTTLCFDVFVNCCEKFCIQAKKNITKKRYRSKCAPSRADTFVIFPSLISSRFGFVSSSAPPTSSLISRSCRNLSLKPNSQSINQIKIKSNQSINQSIPKHCIIFRYNQQQRKWAISNPHRMQHKTWRFGLVAACWPWST